MTKTGTGNVNFTGANTFTGGTIVNAGTLQLDGTFGNTTSVTIAGGTLLLGNDERLNDLATVTITSGTFDLNDHTETIGSLSGTGGTLALGTGNLIIAGTADTTFAGALTGTGTLAVTGTGTLDLTGDSSAYGGSTTVEMGKSLAVNGSLGGNVSVDGMLQGAGVIGGNLTVNGGGIVAPGNSIGTLTIGGAYLPLTNSVLQIETDGTSNDLLIANSATLAGTVNVQSLNGVAPTPNQHYVFLQTTGGITGTFDGITDNLPLVDLLLGYDPNDVYFFVQSNGANFAAVASTPNELAVANYLDQTSGSASGDYRTVVDNLLLLNTSELQAALNQMSGESYGTTAQATIQTTTMSVQQLANHLGSISMIGPGASSGVGFTSSMETVTSMTSSSFLPGSNGDIQRVSHAEETSAPLAATSAEWIACCCCCDSLETQWNAWSVGYGLGGSASSDGNASGAIYGMGGVLTGADRWMDESTLVGLFGGYTGSSFSTGTPSARVNDNAGLGGLYALRRGEILYLSALAGGQGDNYASQRQIDFGGINRNATGNYTGWQGFGYTELGGNLKAGPATLQPFGALQYIHLRQNAFTETGAGSLNLTSGGMDTDSLRSFLGSRAQLRLKGQWTRYFTPEAQASWLHEYSDATTGLNTRFAAIGGNTFAPTGLNAGRDWALLGVGVTCTLTENIQLNCNYFAQTNDRQTYHVGAASLNIQW
ncbi:MAG: autotransporter domain-containing protein [Planctomycetota bacterium]